MASQEITSMSNSVPIQEELSGAPRAIAGQGENAADGSTPGGITKVNNMGTGDSGQTATLTSGDHSNVQNMGLILNDIKHESAEVMWGSTPHFHQEGAAREKPLEDILIEKDPVCPVPIGVDPAYGVTVAIGNGEQKIQKIVMKTDIIAGNIIAVEHMDPRILFKRQKAANSINSLCRYDEVYPVMDVAYQLLGGQASIDVGIYPFVGKSKKDMAEILGHTKAEDRWASVRHNATHRSVNVNPSSGKITVPYTALYPNNEMTKPYLPTETILNEYDMPDDAKTNWLVFMVETDLAGLTNMIPGNAPVLIINAFQQVNRRLTVCRMISNVNKISNRVIAFHQKRLADNGVAPSQKGKSDSNSNKQEPSVEKGGDSTCQTGNSCTPDFVPGSGEKKRLLPSFSSRTGYRLTSNNKTNKMVKKATENSVKSVKTAAKKSKRDADILFQGDAETVRNMLHQYGKGAASNERTDDVDHASCPWTFRDMDYKTIDTVGNKHEVTAYLPHIGSKTSEESYEYNFVDKKKVINKKRYFLGSINTHQFEKDVKMQWKWKMKRSVFQGRTNDEISNWGISFTMSVLCPSKSAHGTFTLHGSTDYTKVIADNPGDAWYHKPVHVPIVDTSTPEGSNSIYSNVVAYTDNDYVYFDFHIKKEAGDLPEDYFDEAVAVCRISIDSSTDEDLIAAQQYERLSAQLTEENNCVYEIRGVTPSDFMHAAEIAEANIPMALETAIESVRGTDIGIAFGSLDNEDVEASCLYFSDLAEDAPDCLVYFSEHFGAGIAIPNMRHSNTYQEWLKLSQTLASQYPALPATHSGIAADPNFWDDAVPYRPEDVPGLIARFGGAVIGTIIAAISSATAAAAKIIDGVEKTTNVVNQVREVKETVVPAIMPSGVRGLKGAAESTTYMRQQVWSEFEREYEEIHGGDDEFYSKFNYRETCINIRLRNGDVGIRAEQFYKMLRAYDDNGVRIIPSSVRELDTGKFDQFWQEVMEKVHKYTGDNFEVRATAHNIVNTYRNIIDSRQKALWYGLSMHLFPDIWQTQPFAPNIAAFRAAWDNCVSHIAPTIEQGKSLDDLVKLMASYVLMAENPSLEHQEAQKVTNLLELITHQDTHFF